MFLPSFVIPLAFILLVFGLPIIAVLTDHQRKMAAILHKGAGNEELINELRAVRAELASLQARVNETTIQVDTINNRMAQPSLSAEQSLQHR